MHGHATLSGPPEQRDSKPDFLVVRHRSPVSTVPNAYNITPGLETKTVPVKKVASRLINHSIRGFIYALILLSDTID